MSPTHSPAMSVQYPVIHRQNISQSSPVYHYPPVPVLQRPPIAYASHSQSRRQSETPRSDVARLQSSVSSAESRWSGMTGLKQEPSSQSYWQATDMEQGLVTGKKVAQSGHSTPYKSSPYSSSRRDIDSNSAVIRYLHEKECMEDYDEKEEDHAFWVLFWLACLDPIHSLISAIYTLLVVITLTIVSPIRLCQKQSSFGDQIIRNLAPIYRNHLEMLKARSVENAFAFEFKPSCLVIVHLTSPLMSMGVMIASWISAAFWLFTIAMGNPDGTERRDDGRDAVISVRNWWEKYLLNAIKKR